MMNDNERSYRAFGIVLSCLCLIIVMMMFSACDSNEEIIPKSSEDGLLNPKIILSYKTPYVGDNSKVVNAIDSLLYSEFRKKVALETESKPYGITVEYEITKPDIGVQEIESNMYLNAVLLFSLIDNVDEISFTFSGAVAKDFKYVRTDIQKHFETDLRDFTESIELFEQLISDISFRVTVFPEKYTPAMSSVPGIRLGSYNLTAVEKVRYSAEKGSLFLWDEEMSENLSIREVSYGAVVYWSPFREGNVAEYGDVITITLLDESGDVIKEHELVISLDDEFMYRVESAPHIITEYGLN